MLCYAVVLYQIQKCLVVKLKGLIPLMPKPTTGMRRVWQDNVKVDIRGNGCDDGRWIELACKPYSEQVSVLTENPKTAVFVYKQ
jgi:hypothetical protein